MSQFNQADASSSDLQEELMASILNFASNRKVRSLSQFETKGIEIYQRNLMASASRALAISYPTIEKLVGSELLQSLSNQFLLEFPKTNHDWAHWGREFSAWLSTHPIADDLPYLVDCALLDWVIHRNFSVDLLSAEHQSLQLLQSEPLDNLRLVLNPTLTVIHSKYPIVDIYLAHQQSSNHPDQIESDLTIAAEKISNGEGDTALIVKHDWHSMVFSFKPEWRHWLNLDDSSSNQSEYSIGELIESSPKSAISFQQWLPLSIEKNIFLKIQKIN